MAIILKHIDKPIYFKKYDGLTGEIEFTPNESEAKKYPNDWFATTELSYLKFHLPEYKEEYLNHMSVAYT